MDVEQLKLLIKKKVTRNNKLYGIFIDGVGSGPMDGGCWAFATALQEVFGGGKLVVIESDDNEKGQAQHVVLKVGKDLFADADGVRDSTKLLSQWKKWEGFKHIDLRLFQEGDVPESPRSREFVDKVVAYLKGVEETNHKSKAKLVMEVLGDDDQ
jgi:hypothetical protein